MAHRPAGQAQLSPEPCASSHGRAVRLCRGRGYLRDHEIPDPVSGASQKGIEDHPREGPTQSRRIRILIHAGGCGCVAGRRARREKDGDGQHPGTLGISEKGQKEFEKIMEGYHDLVDHGRREIYRIEG